MSHASGDALLIAFARLLRHTGLPVSPDRTQAFLQACAQVGAGQRSGVYWSGRATLCASPDDVEMFDKAFDTWFSTTDAPLSTRGQQPPRQGKQAALDDDSGGGDDNGVQLNRAQASAEEVLRHRDIAKLGEIERGRLVALFATLRVRAPQRRAMRKRPNHRGNVDFRLTLRDQLRRGGEIGALRMRKKRRRSRKVVLLIDVSGSMEPYADSLVRLAHRISRGIPGQVEVFTIGTRLTRITTAMQARHGDDALAAVGASVSDWSGGTRLGEVLQAFVSRWGRRGLARGAVVVIASDGWERGDPSLLGEQTRQLKLLAHSLVWMNPHRGKEGYAPVQGGIAASLPWLDHLVAGHSMASFAELLDVIADA
ncbi:MAG: VWA domain-containing protein [Propionibacteriaceae bacterium]|nr:VWA domain-containing protein [Propionibacteriaceae bacterium]